MHRPGGVASPPGCFSYWPSRRRLRTRLAAPRRNYSLPISVTRTRAGPMPAPQMNFWRGALVPAPSIAAGQRCMSRPGSRSALTSSPDPASRSASSRDPPPLRLPGDRPCRCAELLGRFRVWWNSYSAPRCAGREMSRTIFWRKLWISFLSSSLSFCFSEAVAIGDTADGGNSGLYLLTSLSAMVAELGPLGLSTL